MKLKHYLIKNIMINKMLYVMNVKVKWNMKTTMINNASS